MPVVSSVKRTTKENNVSISQKILKHEDIYNDILYKIIYSKASLINTVQSSFLTNNKETKASKEALVGEIKRLCKEKAKAFSFNQDEMSSRIMNFLLGYGIIQELIEDEDITDIDFTRYNYCTIKKNGTKKRINISFNSDKEFQNFATLMIIRNGGIINADENHRRESDEKYRLRINVAIPPRNVTGTSLIIRKHRLNPYSLKDLINLGMINQNMATYFRNSFKHTKYNTIFVGQGASGKTTLLRACLMETDPLKNFLICEKDTELYLNNYSNFIIQKIKKKNDGGKPLNLTDLVADGLTMSLEGMVIGELIGEEVYDFLSAGYTDHVTYGTCHTSGVKDTPKRLLTMTSTRKLSEYVVKEIIGGSIQDIVYLDDFKVKEIKRIKNYNKLEDKFEYLNIMEMIERGEKIESI